MAGGGPQSPELDGGPSNAVTTPPLPPGPGGPMALLLGVLPPTVGYSGWAGNWAWPAPLTPPPKPLFGTVSAR